MSTFALPLSEAEGDDPPSDVARLVARVVRSDEVVGTSGGTMTVNVREKDA